ncbi:PP2C family serine/threonine-protein phosphatase [Georgenia muralis]|uniref:Serine/threonine protein phosphatase PrpC n=1 Tax=Georgenia muralis TaxID=154117 RepID=A0A3N4ZU81_9MICO|nr:PP2C family serine/threonine-protein phosphatase [Georgenia muralis]RPF29042.1 serine/threonine protein phosphatase PrpC [Georgenia muralis]
MGGRWREFAYQVRGKSHVLDGKPGQDRFRYESRSGVQVLCLADGAGSAKLAEHGAQAVVAAGCDFIVDLFESGRGWRGNLDGNALHAHLIEKLNGTAARIGCELKDLASTFLCVAVTEEFFVAAQIGDGVIGAERDGELELVTLPDNGEFPNVTTFVTSKNAVPSMQITKGELDGYNGFILMSDGTAESLYNYERRVLARACRTLFRIISDAPTYAVANPAYKKELKRVMDLQIREGTDDDCSIGILARSTRVVGA